MGDVKGPTEVIDMAPPQCRMHDDYGLVHHATSRRATMGACYMVNTAWTVGLTGVLTDEPLTCLRCATMVFHG